MVGITDSKLNGLLIVYNTASESMESENWEYLRTIISRSHSQKP